MRSLKIILLLITCLLSGNVLMANPITVDDAKQKVREFLTTSHAKRVKGNLKLSLAYSMNNTSLTNEKDENVLYAFNIGEENGFVIVSGDDIAVPILGYCDHGSFDAENIPSNVKAWLDGYGEQIQKAKSQGINGSGLAVNSRSDRSYIDVMLSSMWNQNSPFNDQCVFNGKRCLTGCLATATAQMVYYWATKGRNGNKFRCGSKALEPYTTKTNGYSVGAVGALNSFDWDNMTDGIPTTTASKNAVAQLLRYCGQALQADFGEGSTYGSLSKMINAMKNMFGYNLGISGESESKYTLAEWDEMIYGQLADGKPVIINGEGSAGGHGFICDGYKPDEDKYHMNWGWGGKYDGWFVMTSLNPSFYVLNDNKFAVININPLEESTYVILSPDEKTLTFYCDTEKDSRNGTMYVLNNSYIPEWGSKNTITNVVFDSSFAKARPKTTEYWFHKQENLQQIIGLEYLNTSEVKSMLNMFNGCSSLTSLDVSHFDTSNVTSMGNMFNGCSSLTSLDVSRFNTSNVTTMGSMFNSCSSLTSLDLSSFNMGDDLNANGFLYSCKGLKDLYVPSKMAGLNTTASSGVGTTAAPCIVHAPEGFDFGEGVDTSTLYFKWYAGNFYLYGTTLAYATLADGTLSFYVDDNPWVRDGSILRINDSGAPSWYGMRESVSTVYFDQSFKQFSPITTYQWFANMANLTNINGIENLNTSRTENMQMLCYNCAGLTSLDLSGFDVSSVTSATNMLFGCKGLKDLYVSESMSSLKEFTNVCAGIGTSTSPCFIHAPEGFDFGEGVNTSSIYFRWCTGFFYLYGTKIPYSILSEDKLTFYYDEKAWQREPGIAPYGMNITSNPGWFSSNASITLVTFDPSFADASPTSTYRWFYGMTSLTEIEGLNYLNPTDVTNMGQMFYNCNELASLNLSKFDLTNVTNFANFFFGCRSLKTLHIHESMSLFAATACSGIGTADSPCEIFAPEGFDFGGVDTSGDYFRWKAGYFVLGKKVLLLGDVNGDGVVNISDVVCLTSYVLGQDPDPFVIEVADVSDDGEINVTDVVALVNLILNQ